MKRTAQQFSEPQHYNVINALSSLTRVFVRLGVIDRERKEFWRFFSKTLLKHRNRVAESLRLAAMGYHFRKLSDAYSESYTECISRRIRSANSTSILPDSIIAVTS